MNTKDLLNKGKLHPRKFCPFCGAAGGKKTKKDTSGTMMHYIECVHCGARTKYHKYLANAIAQWDHQIHDTKQRKGQWHYKEDEGLRYIECSECSQRYAFYEDEDIVYTKYCPECGARLIQKERTDERRLGLHDQIEAAGRIQQEKKEKDREKKIETYRQREMAEAFLKQMIGLDDEDDENT